MGSNPTPSAKLVRFELWPRTRGPGGLPLEQVTGTTPLWYHADQLGSTRSLTDAAGAVKATATYDPYGRLTTSTGTSSALGFAGEYTDTETGFSYLRARYYDPVTGQFITRDPLESITGEPYGYVGGNPLNAVDPTGRYFGEGLVNGVASLGKAAWDNRDVIATVTAAGACIVASAGYCAAALTVAFTARAQMRVQEQGFRASLGENIADAVLTTAMLGSSESPASSYQGRRSASSIASAPGHFGSVV